MPGADNTVDHAVRAAASRGDQPFLRYRDETLTYAGLEEQTGRVANGLQAMGLAQNDHVALFMGNRIEFVTTWFGAARAGNPIIPVNAGLVGKGLAQLVNHSDAKVVVTEAELLPALMAVRDQLDNVRDIVVVDDDEKKGNPLLADAGAPDIATQPNDLMMLMYTSGTTGMPKGIVIPQSRIMGGQFVFRTAGVTEADRPYTCLPLFHGNAAFISLSGAFGMGLTLALGRKYSASRFWDEVRHFDATTFNTLGAMISIIWKQDPRSDDADNPVRLVLSAACPKDIWKPFEERFGVNIVEFYGTVEGGLTMAGPDAPVGSIGKPVLGNEARIERDDGTECDPDEIGNLIFRPTGGAGAKVAYYKNEEASGKKTEGGWLRTGDRAYKDAEGWIWYVDRADHFMRRRGENISSTEVEQIVEGHDDVLEVAAYGVPSELGEDEVMIAVVAKLGHTVAPAALIDYCVENMAAFQIPRYVRLMDALPKTETHRAQKLKLREEGVVAGTYDREANK